MLSKRIQNLEAPVSSSPARRARSTARSGSKSRSRSRSLGRMMAEKEMDLRKAGAKVVAQAAMQGHRHR